MPSSSRPEASPSERLRQALERPYSYYNGVEQGIAPYLRRTCTVQPYPLRQMGLGNVWVKEECLQVTGSYKARGGLQAVRSLTPAQKKAGIVCPTPGNGGTGLAYAAGLEGVETTLVVPENASEEAMDQLRSFGPHVHIQRHGAIWDDAYAQALKIAQERGLAFIHPFDSLAFVDGAATIAVEILEDVPEVASVVVPVGGGGLLAGICLALAAARPEVRVHGVEPVGAASLYHSLAAGHPVALESVQTVAKSLAVRRVGEFGFEAARFFAAEITLVTDSEIDQAVAFAFNHLRLVLEPAGAAGLAAVLSGKLDVGGMPSVVLLSGGSLPWPDAVRAIAPVRS
jgi:threonine dehydratase